MSDLHLDYGKWITEDPVVHEVARTAICLPSSVQEGSENSIQVGRQFAAQASQVPTNSTLFFFFFLKIQSNKLKDII